MHIADGAVGAKKLTTELRKEKEINIYNYILKKHKVSRVEFEETLQYYSKNTKKYEKLYAEIVAELKEKEAAVIITKNRPKNETAKKDDNNLWPLKESWNLPEDGKTNPISYKIKNPEHGIYTLSARIRVFKDDGSVSQRMTIMVKYKDGSSAENSFGNIKKDGKYTTHEVFINTDKTKELKEISGWVLNHSKGTNAKHASVRKISLTLKKISTIK